MSQGRPEKTSLVLPSEAKKNSQANSKNIEGQTVTGMNIINAIGVWLPLDCILLAHRGSVKINTPYYGSFI